MMRNLNIAVKKMWVHGKELWGGVMHYCYYKYFAPPELFKQQNHNIIIPKETKTRRCNMPPAGKTYIEQKINCYSLIVHLYLIYIVLHLFYLLLTVHVFKCRAGGQFDILVSSIIFL